MTPEQPPVLPVEAYPIASYGEARHTTPDAIRNDSTENAHLLYISGLIIGTPRGADDTRLRAGIDISRRISQAAERYGSELRAELERRERERQAELAAAAERTTHGVHPYPDGVEPFVEVTPEAARLLGPVEPVDDTCRTLTLPQYEETVDAAQ